MTAPGGLAARRPVTAADVARMARRLAQAAHVVTLLWHDQGGRRSGDFARAARVARWRWLALLRLAGALAEQRGESAPVVRECLTRLAVSGWLEADR